MLLYTVRLGRQTFRLKGVFAKNEKGYRLYAIKKRLLGENC